MRIERVQKEETVSASRRARRSAKSGAAGAAVFPGFGQPRSSTISSRRAARRRTTRTSRSTCSRIRSGTLLQDWIIRFPDGTPTYSKTWTKALSSDWHKFRAVDQEWERTHYQRQSTICGMVQGVIENARKSGAPKRFDKAWVKVLQDHVGAYKHAEFGLGTVDDAGAALRLHPDDQQRDL